MIFGLNNVVFFVLAGGVVITAVAVMVGLAVIKQLRSSQRERFEPENIEEIIKPEIRQLVDYWGSSTSSILRYRWDEKGKVAKQLDNTSDIEIETDNDEYKDITIDEEQLEKDYEEGKISERVYRMITEFGQEPINILIVRPKGFLGLVKHSINAMFSINKTLNRIILVPERLLRDDIDYLTIKKNADFRRFAGMDVAVEASVFNFIESIGFKNLYAQSLEDQQNYHKQVNFFASQFSQELQKLEKEANVEGQKYSGRNSEIFNEN